MASATAVLLAIAALALAIVGAGWVAYPLWMRARRARPLRRDAPGVSHTVACVVATREPPAVVRARVADVRARASGARLEEIVVALDRDAVASDAEYADAVAPHARVVRAVDAPGKASALNAGLQAARADVVVLTDSAQRFEHGAVAALAAAFSSPDVGAASGRLCLPHDERPGSVLGGFWRYELALRRAESRIDSLVAVTGAVYAIRRELWPRLPPGLICDDLYVPLHVVRAGRRVVHCDAARAVDPRTFTREQEFARKVRTLTGMVQVCAWAPWVLSPWRNRVWTQFVCHKLVRLATPLLLLVAVACLASALALEGRLEPLVRVAILAAGVPLILLDLLRPRLARALLDRAGLALRLLASPLVALSNGARGEWNVWSTHAATRARR